MCLRTFEDGWGMTACTDLEPVFTLEAFMESIGNQQRVTPPAPSTHPTSGNHRAIMGQGRKKPGLTASPSSQPVRAECKQATAQSLASQHLEDLQLTWGHGGIEEHKPCTI